MNLYQFLFISGLSIGAIFAAIWIAEEFTDTIAKELFTIALVLSGAAGLLRLAFEAFVLLGSLG